MERIVAVVREHLADYPLQLYDIMLACIEDQGLAAVLDAIGEVHGNAGQRYFRIVHRKRIPYGRSDSDAEPRPETAKVRKGRGASTDVPVRAHRRTARKRHEKEPVGVHRARVRMPAVPRV
ncbi:MAG TPA: hypothetical protein VGM51_02505 [Armatimonadota bacterium]|jgi:hypothetical protein